MRKYLLLAISALLFFGSCANYKKIEISNASIKDARIVSASRYQVEVEVEVDNPSGMKFVVKEADGVVFKDGEPFADITVPECVTIPARGVNRVGIPCEISLRNPLAALAIGLNYKSLDWDSFTVDGKVTVKGGPVKKAKEFKNVPLRKLFNYIKNKVR